MSPILKNVLAVVAGVIIGGLVNMALISLGGMVISPPAGVDVSDPESIKANMHLYETKHFIIPFLAHALGTLVGAFTAVKIAHSNHLYLALAIGGFFLIGGIMMVNMVGGPLWFIILDLVGAYIPMGWLGWKLGKGNS